MSARPSSRSVSELASPSGASCVPSTKDNVFEMDSVRRKHHDTIAVEHGDPEVAFSVGYHTVRLSVGRSPVDEQTSIRDATRVKIKVVRIDLHRLMTSLALSLECHLTSCVKQPSMLGKTDNGVVEIHCSCQ